MEDDESLIFKNICNECGLPMKFHSFEKIQIDTKNYIVVKLFCQNLEHKTTIKLSFEDYQSIIDESLENICKCTSCNKYILEKSITPYYCYTCKKIICSDCLNNNHEKEHKNVFNYNTLINKCLIHPDLENDCLFFCPICKTNYCEQCVANDLEHMKSHNWNNIKQYISDNELIKKNIEKIKGEILIYTRKKEGLVEELKKLNNLINFNVIFNNKSYTSTKSYKLN